MKKVDRSMKARSVVLSALDASLIFGIWSKGTLERGNLRVAVEVNDRFEEVLETRKQKFEAVGNATNGSEEKEGLVQALIDDTAAILLSQAAFESIETAVKEHKGWTNRGARQLDRIEEALKVAEWVDLEPKAEVRKEAAD